MNAQEETYLIEDESLVKPEVQLVGMDGNAFAIIGRVMGAWKRLGRFDIAEEFQARATSGDYNTLLAIAMEYVDEEAAWGEDEEEDEEEEYTFYEEEEEDGDYGE